MARFQTAAAAPLSAAFLSACTTVPSPEVSLPDGNAQIRLTEAAGTVEGGAGGFFGGGANGKSCILTTLGALPAGSGELRQGECVFSFVGDATDNDGRPGPQ